MLKCCCAEWDERIEFVVVVEMAHRRPSRYMLSSPSKTYIVIIGRDGRDIDYIEAIHEPSWFPACLEISNRVMSASVVSQPANNVGGAKANLSYW